MAVNRKSRNANFLQHGSLMKRNLEKNGNFSDIPSPKKRKKPVQKKKK